MPIGAYAGRVMLQMYRGTYTDEATIIPTRPCILVM